LLNRGWLGPPIGFGAAWFDATSDGPGESGRRCCDAGMMRSTFAVGPSHAPNWASCSCYAHCFAVATDVRKSNACPNCWSP
jgi:hypothetical protein